MTLVEFTRSVSELKSIHQTLGAIGVRWHRCKPGSKGSQKYKRAHDDLTRKSYALSDALYAAIMERDATVERLERGET